MQQWGSHDILLPLAISASLALALNQIYYDKFYSVSANAGLALGTGDCREHSTCNFYPTGAHMLVKCVHTRVLSDDKCYRESEAGKRNRELSGVGEG
jgi:hypothetical protein